MSDGIKEKLEIANKKLQEIFYQAKHCQREIRGGFSNKHIISRLELIKNIVEAKDLSMESLTHKSFDNEVV